MTSELRMALEEVLHKAQPERDVDLLRDGVRVMAQVLLELEVRQYLGGAKHERTTSRTGQRNGYRPWRVGRAGGRRCCCDEPPVDSGTNQSASHGPLRGGMRCSTDRPLFKDRSLLYGVRGGGFVKGSSRQRR